MTLKTLKDALSWGKKKDVADVFRRSSGHAAADALSRAAKQANKDQKELMERYKRNTK